MQVTVYVCTTCRSRTDEPDDPATRPGQRMYDALSNLANSAVPTRGAVRIEPVECLSVCTRAATIAIASTSRWTYIYADLDPDKDAKDILEGAAAYAETNDGIVPWRERVAIFKRNVVARIPPFPSSVASVAPSAICQTEPATDRQLLKKQPDKNKEESPTS